MRRLQADRMNQEIFGPKHFSCQVNNDLLWRIEHAVGNWIHSLLTAKYVDIVVNRVGMQHIFEVLDAWSASLHVPSRCKDSHLTRFEGVRHNFLSVGCPFENSYQLVNHWWTYEVYSAIHKPCNSCWCLSITSQNPGGVFLLQSHYPPQNWKTSHLTTRST